MTEESAGPRPQCTATTRAGHQCKQWTTVNDSGRCLFHDDGRKAERRAVQQLGGINAGAPVLPKRIPRAPKTLGDLVAYLSWIVNATARGELDKDTAAKMTYTLTSMRGALTQRDLEHQVARLRAELKAAKAPGRRTA